MKPVSVAAAALVFVFVAVHLITRTRERRADTRLINDWVEEMFRRNISLHRQVTRHPWDAGEAQENA